jgi:hypothetical protein
MLRHYWKLPDTAVILFELERSHSDGTTRRGGIPPEIWAEVLESPVESIFVTVVDEKQDPPRRHAPQKPVQFTAPTPTPVPTVSTRSISSYHTTTSEGEEYSGGAARPSRKKNHSSTPLSPRKKGWREVRRRAQGKSLELDRGVILTYFSFTCIKGAIPCRQCLAFGIPCVLQTPTAFICVNCKTDGLSCSNKPRDIGKIEYALRSRQLSPDARGSVLSALDSEPASSLIQDGSAEHVIGVDDSCSIISDSEEYDELQE